MTVALRNIFHKILTFKQCAGFLAGDSACTSNQLPIWGARRARKVVGAVPASGQSYFYGAIDFSRSIMCDYPSGSDGFSILIPWFTDFHNKNDSLNSAIYHAWHLLKIVLFEISWHFLLFKKMCVFAKFYEQNQVISSNLLTILSVVRGGRKLWTYRIDRYWSLRLWTWKHL